MTWLADLGFLRKLTVIRVMVLDSHAAVVNACDLIFVGKPIHILYYDNSNSAGLRRTRIPWLITLITIRYLLR